MAPWITPETELERELLHDSRLCAGLEWGAPRIGKVLISDDGLRVVPLWRWQGSRRELIDRDADVVREALVAHPIFADTGAVEARIVHPTTGGV